MRSFIPIVALLGLVAAQSETSNTASSTTSSATADSTTACLAACDVSDVNCKAGCVNTPAPNESMVLATNECSKNECTQGDSGPEDTKKYGECLASCASDFYYVSGGTPTGVATAHTNTAASTPASGSADSTTGSGGSAATTGSSSQTGSMESSARQAASTASESAGGLKLFRCMVEVYADKVFSVRRFVCVFKRRCRSYWCRCRSLFERRDADSLRWYRWSRRGRPGLVRRACQFGVISTTFSATFAQ
jgi:hypothetical protein